MSGAVVWSTIYDSFGKATINTGVVTNNLRFAGQYFDAETGLHYNYHRYYDPSTGRYLNPDPIGLAGGINLFAYVGGNPINDVDPLGLIRGARRYRSFGSQNPYAAMEYNALYREIRRADPSFSLIRNTNRDVTWRDVNFLRDQLWNIRYRAANRCSNESNNTSSGGFGDLGSHGPMSEDAALQYGTQWVGPGYREVGPNGSGVFRSANNSRQFRITDADITGGHGPLGPHVHFESLNPQGRVVENLHIPIVP